MLFNSLEFFAFFAAVWAGYLGLGLLGRSAGMRGQNALLLLASYLFYGAWDWRFLGLIAASTLIDFSVARRIGASDDPKLRKRLLTVSVVANLGFLCFFKYMGFFADSLADLFGLVGLELPAMAWEIVLPVGISFYTFQTMSYTFDVYRRRMEPSSSLFNFALYVAFFPQLVAGPIERALRLLPQIERPRKVTWEGVGSGAWLVLSGTFKKVVVADNLSLVVVEVFNSETLPTGWEILVGCYCFAWKIYGDFSGYSDVARGIARMMGFELMLNFNLPHLSTSPADFWRRWHISLSTWLRDYLFIPLGGTRGTSLQVYRNLFVTLLLAGLWHGASWNKVLWGFFIAILVVTHRAVLPKLEKVVPATLVGRSFWWTARVVFTFHLFCVSWVIFVPTTFGYSLELFAVLGDPWEVGRSLGWIVPYCVLVIPVLIMHAFQVRSDDLECVLRWPLPLRALTYAATFFAIVLLGEDFGQPFFYFQF